MKTETQNVKFITREELASIIPHGNVFTNVSGTARYIVEAFVPIQEGKGWKVVDCYAAVAGFEIVEGGYSANASSNDDLFDQVNAARMILKKSEDDYQEEKRREVARMRMSPMRYDQMMAAFSGKRIPA